MLQYEVGGSRSCFLLVQKVALVLLMCSHSQKIDAKLWQQIATTQKSENVGSPPGPLDRSELQGVHEGQCDESDDSDKTSKASCLSETKAAE